MHAYHSCKCRCVSIALATYKWPESEAVLPAYLVGLVIACVLMHNPVLVDCNRSIVFALLTPFYFLMAGSLISLSALLTWTSSGLVALFLLTKLIAKIVGIRPLTQPFGSPARVGSYMTLLIATGLTFGSISALYGYTCGYIDQTQHTILVTVVILSAIAPNLIAQSFFPPAGGTGEAVVGAGVGALTAAGNDDGDMTVVGKVAGSLDESGDDTRSALQSAQEEAAAIGMFKRILVAFDGSQGSERTLVIISFVEQLPSFAGMVGEVEEGVRKGEQALHCKQERAVRLAQELGIPASKTLLATEHAAQVIVRVV
jgi:hypothetical protein